MKFVIVFAALLAVAVARPQKQVDVVRYDNDNIGVGPFSFNVELSDGSAHQQSGQLKNVGTENEALAVTGSFKFVGDDGVTYTVTYVADENGFQPQGAHLPVPPQP